MTSGAARRTIVVGAVRAVPPDLVDVALSDEDDDHVAIVYAARHLVIDVALHLRDRAYGCGT